jgi:hypothetical protein
LVIILGVPSPRLSFQEVTVNYGSDQKNIPENEDDECDSLIEEVTLVCTSGRTTYRERIEQGFISQMKYPYSNTSVLAVAAEIRTRTAFGPSTFQECVPHQWEPPIFIS